jgi:hypothetical protein
MDGLLGAVAVEITQLVLLHLVVQVVVEQVVPDHQIMLGMELSALVEVVEVQENLI